MTKEELQELDELINSIQKRDELNTKEGFNKLSSLEKTTFLTEVAKKIMEHNTGPEDIIFFLENYMEHIVKVQKNDQLDLMGIITLADIVYGIDATNDYVENFIDKMIKNYREFISSMNLEDEKQQWKVSSIANETHSLFKNMIKIGNQYNEEIVKSTNASDKKFYSDLYDKQMSVIFDKLTEYLKPYENKSEKEKNVLNNLNQRLIPLLSTSSVRKKGVFLDMMDEIDLDNIMDKAFNIKVKTNENGNLNCQIYLETTNEEFQKVLKRNSYAKTCIRDSLFNFSQFKSSYQVVIKPKVINFNHQNTRDDSDKSPTLFFEVKSESLEAVSEIVRKILLDSLTDCIAGSTIQNKEYWSNEIEGLLRDVSLLEKTTEIDSKENSKRVKGKI